jgi:uncharacterized protein YndB with AHSA1/START domain
MAGFMATAETDISADPERVWAALVDPDQIKEYMFGSQVVTDWQPGSSIVWKGEYEGKSFQDKGEVLDVEPNRRLQMTHFSPLSGQPDVPSNYHTLTYELTKRGAKTHVVLSQDNNSTADEAKHSTANWQSMLDGLKTHVESAGAAG